MAMGTCATAPQRAENGERELAGRIRTVLAAARTRIATGELQEAATYLIVAADLQRQPILQLMAELCRELVRKEA